MAAAEVARQPSQPHIKEKKKPFANFLQRLTRKGNNSGHGSDHEQKRLAKHNKKNSSKDAKNNPYPESGALKQHNGYSPESSANGQLSFATSNVNGSGHEDTESFQSGQRHQNGSEEVHASNKSGAPTLATIPGTIQSDTGHSKAATATTAGGAFSSLDGAGAGSTFSSPAPSERSLATTLTTIQSQGAASALQNGGHHSNGVMFSHQYPTSPNPANGLTASAIPRHLADPTGPNTYNTATANNLLTDDASVLTLASSSKRRRRSMDTDASVRALAPSSMFGGSRESLPLSVLSGGTNLDREPPNSAGGALGSSGLYSASHSRPSIGGLAQAERASVYSSYSHKNKDLADAKSLRSVTNLDARSQYDARSLAGDARSQMDGRSQLEGRHGGDRDVGSMKSGLLGHGRSDSMGSPLASPGLRQTGGLSRRSSDWQEMREKSDEEDHADTEEGAGDAEAVRHEGQEKLVEEKKKE